MLYICHFQIRHFSSRFLIYRRLLLSCKLMFLLRVPFNFVSHSLKNHQTIMLWNIRELTVITIFTTVCCRWFGLKKNGRIYSLDTLQCLLIPILMQLQVVRTWSEEKCILDQTKRNQKTVPRHCRSLILNIQRSNDD